MKILIMGLSGAGKTWLAKRLQSELNCAWYNADAVRKAANDWDFSEAGRDRQAWRMRNLANFETSNGRMVICDFISPTEMARKIFDPDILIWIDTIDRCKYEDTNEMFEPPEHADIHITEHLKEEEIPTFCLEMFKKVLKTPTSSMAEQSPYKR